MYLIRWVDLGLLEKLPELLARRVDVAERGPASRLPEKGPTKKVRGRRFGREGPSEKICHRRSAEEGPLEKVRGRRAVGKGPLEKVRWKSGSNTIEEKNNSLIFIN